MPRLVNALFSRPNAILPLLDEAAVAAQDRMLHSRRFQELNERNADQVDAVANVGTVKRLVRVRVDLHRISCPGISPPVPQVRTRHTGRLLSLSGTVMRVGAVKSHEVEHLMECTKCKHRFLVSASKEDGRSADLPPTCPSSQDELNHDTRKPCNGTSFNIVPAGRPIVCDYQELRLQEPTARTRTYVGAVWTLSDLVRGGEKPTGQGKTAYSSAAAPPRALLVIVEDDLVDSCKPGDDVCITLTMQWRWHRASREQRAELELVGHATTVHVLNKDTSSLGHVNEQDTASFAAFWQAHNRSSGASSEMRRPRPLVGRDVIVQSICPQLCGLYNAKLAILLALIGGVPRVEPDTGISIRGENHLLIVGDPGMGKSQLLRYAAQVAPRAIMTTGMGSTAAGLTAAAVKADGGEGWTLEAGALVLADGGVCCIDEFDTISVDERAAIHEAMEQQTVSIAKGGMVATLQTRCAVLGATNPKGMKYDKTASIVVNTGLAPPLLSRFDCILVLLDERDPQGDIATSEHMIKSHCGERPIITPSREKTKVGSGQHVASKAVEDLETGFRRHSGFGERTLKELDTASCSTECDGGTFDGIREGGKSGCTGEMHAAANDIWPFERVRRYIAHVRRAFEPVITPEAESLIRGYYKMRRRSEDTSLGRPTIRLLESLIRLTQAHARLMWRTQANRSDVVVAVDLIEASTHTIMDGGKGSKRTFSDPDSALQQREMQLIRRITADIGAGW